MWRDLRRRCRGLLRRTAVERELEEEFQFHLDHQVTRYLDAGLARSEAERRAHLDFGGVTQIRDDCRDAWGVRLADDVWRDLRVGLRSLRWHPGFLAAAVLSLAVGIAVNIFVFACVTALFWPAFPVADQSRVMMIYSTTTARSGAFTQYQATSYLNATAYRDQNDVFTGLTVIVDSTAPLEVAGISTPALVNLINADYFDVLGVRPALGRPLIADDEASAAPPAIVVSHAVWTDRFGSDPGVLGSVIHLNQQSYTVVGVMPAAFRDVGALPPADVWVPVRFHDQILVGPIHNWFTERAARVATMVGRLKPGVSIRQAEASLRTLGDQLAHEFPRDNAGRNVMVVPLDRTVMGPAQRGLYVQAGMIITLLAGLVLLIACVNVAHLLLARALDRRREFAIRLSLGASRAHVVRQLLIESVLLAGAAAGLGLLTAGLARAGLERWVPVGLLPPLHVTFDTRVLLFTVFLAVAVTLLCGLAPAVRALGTWTSSRPEHATAPGRRGLIDGSRLLVVAQVSLSLVAVCIAALFLRSVQQAQQAALGFDLGGEVSAMVDLEAFGDAPPRLAAFYETVVQRLRALPTVAHASLTDTPPLSGSYRRTTFSADVDRADPSNGRLTGIVAIAPGFFETSGMRLLRGRDIKADDRADHPMVAVVNEAAAATLWPGADPLGKRLRFLLQDWDVEVVGVVNTVTDHALDEAPQPIVYVPLLQHPTPHVVVTVRTRGEARTLVDSTRAVVASLAPTGSSLRMQTGCDLRDQFLMRRRIGAQVLTVCGGLALVLAMVGTWGIVSHATGQRRREIAIRVALGAPRSALMRRMLRESFASVAMGLVLGMGMAAAVTHAIARLLYGVAADDPVALGGAVLLLVLSGLVACGAPVWRITGVDPMRVLRSE